MKINIKNIVNYQLLGLLFCTVAGFFAPDIILRLFSIIGVLSVGILHGANDLLLIKKSFYGSKINTYFKRLGVYLFLVAVVTLSLFWIPLTALIVFVLVSAFHFGEQQWHQNQKENFKKQFFYFSFGLFLFSTLFFFNSIETQLILEQLTSWYPSKNELFFFLVISFILFVALAIWNYNSIRNQLEHQFMILILLFTLFAYSNLLWSFSVYFVLLHSIPSMKEQMLFLYKTEYKLKNYIMDAIPYWSISILGLGILVLYSSSFSLEFSSLFFAFLAAITIPHVFVVFKMHQVEDN